jgi:hypothetical protein
VQSSWGHEDGIVTGRGQAGVERRADAHALRADDAGRAGRRRRDGVDGAGRSLVDEHDVVGGWRARQDGPDAALEQPGTAEGRDDDR